PYKWLVVWTVKGKDFVCVEPWTARANALNSKDGLVHIGPRERRKSFIAITAL
ncbi:aldose epimerase, partial [Haliangium sp. UPWRP_2]